MEVPRGFTRCDECEGGGWEPLPPFDGTIERISKPCPSCSGSGLVPTEKLREEARYAALDAFGESEHRTTWSWPKALNEAADAVLRKVAEHIGERR